MKLKTNIKMTAIALAALFAFQANAGEENPAAPEAVVTEAKQMCAQDATDAGVDQDGFDDYVLTCVNEELEGQGYRPVDSI